MKDMSLFSAGNYSRSVSLMSWPWEDGKSREYIESMDTINNNSVTNDGVSKAKVTDKIYQISKWLVN